MDDCERDTLTITLSASGRLVALDEPLRRRLALPASGAVPLDRIVTRPDGGPLDHRTLMAMGRDAMPLPPVRLADAPDGTDYAMAAAVARRGRLRAPRLVLRLRPAEPTLPHEDLARAADAHLLTAVLAPDGTVLVANAVLLATFGYEAADVIGEDHAILVAPRTTESPAYRRIWRGLREGTPHHGTMPYRTAAGDAAYLSAHYVPVTARDGAVRRIVMVAQCVTAEQLSARDAHAKVAALDASQAIVEFDPDGRILSANRNFLRSFDYEPQDVVGEHHRIFVPQDARDHAYTKFWHELRRGEFASGQFLRLGRDGRRIWIQATYNPIRNERGDVVKVVKFATDVTERVEREALLASQTNALQRSTAVVQFDLDGTILDANDNFVTAMGYAHPGDIVGRHHSIFVEPGEETSEPYRLFWRRLRQGDVHSGEFVRRGRSGDPVWIQATYNPMLDAEGRVIRIVKFAADVTEAKKTAAKLSGQIAAIERSQATVQFDVEGHVVDVNQNFLDALGYRREDVIGRHHAMFCDPAYAASDEYREHWRQLAAGEFVSGEFERRSSTGAVVWIRGVYHPVLDPTGKLVGVFKSANDITAEIADRRRVELLSTVTDETANSVIITDPEGRIQYVNRGFTEMTGYGLDDIRGKAPYDFLQGPRTDPATVARIRAKRERGEPFHDEVLLYTRAGRPQWTSLAINPVHDADGAVRSFVTIHSNIDATKRQSLEFTRRLEAIGATSAVAEWDASGAPLLRNRYLDEMGGAPIGFDALLEAGERACVINGETIRREVHWPRRGDAPMTLDAVFNSVCDDEGTVSKVLMFGIDVTERNDLVRSAMATIEASTDRIEGMVGTIQDIANQTRTLSLNATVEASKAGDAGRGFAVVAGEVRGLADRATQAASQIAALLRENRARAKALDGDAVEAREWASAERGRRHDDPGRRDAG